MTQDDPFSKLVALAQAGEIARSEKIPGAHNDMWRIYLNKEGAELADALGLQNFSPATAGTNHYRIMAADTVFRVLGEAALNRLEQAFEQKHTRDTPQMALLLGLAKSGDLKLVHGRPSRILANPKAMSQLADVPVHSHQCPLDKEFSRVLLDCSIVKQVGEGGLRMLREELRQQEKQQGPKR